MAIILGLCKSGVWVLLFEILLVRRKCDSNLCKVVINRLVMVFSDEMFIKRVLLLQMGGQDTTG